jgi:7-carboxy-7-deazaguanine synthase
MSDTELPVAEQFYSVQGEGAHAGVPAVFLRLAGCNLCCGGWENKDRDPGDFEPEDDALWVCDTIDVWREADATYTGADLLADWEARGWADSVDNGAHIVLTGGEPTLPGSQKAFLSFYAAWLKEGYDAPYVEVETNGTIEPQPAFDKYVNQYNVSLKLSNSGMSRDERINPDALDHYAHQAIDDMAVFKFVVGSEDDLEEILSIVEEFDLPQDSIMLMPAGQTKEQLAETYPLVAEMCKERGWRFSPRLHVSIWDQATGV